MGKRTLRCVWGHSDDEADAGVYVWPTHAYLDTLDAYGDGFIMHIYIYIPIPTYLRYLPMEFIGKRVSVVIAIMSTNFQTY